jgi:hypothetical protein
MDRTGKDLPCGRRSTSPPSFRTFSRRFLRDTCDFGVTRKHEEGYFVQASKIDPDFGYTGIASE